MRPRDVLTLIVAGLLAIISVSPAQAQPAPPVRIRGTIETADAHMITVKTRNGDRVEVALADTLAVLAVRNVPLSEIGGGAFVGVATRTGADGTQQAIEILLFPEAMRGVGEGSYPWDLEPGSTMTNGSVGGVVTAASQTELIVTYKGGSKTIRVVGGTPIVTFVPAERADVKPGAKVFVVAAKGVGGLFSAGRVVVGKDGVAPPM